MRSFSEFNTALPADAVERADAAHLRSVATWAYLLLRPGMEFVRQRSNFILGWQAASSAAGTVASGVSAGAVGDASRPPLGSWMILPELSSPATRTVLPSHDALYGAAHLELDLLGPVVLTVPANLDDRYFSVAVMDAHFNNVGRIGPRWTGNDAQQAVVLPPGWVGSVPDGMMVIQAPTVSVCVFNRMLVGYADGDMDRVREWQAGLRFTQLRHWGEADPVMDAVAVDSFVHPDLNTTTDPFEYLRIGLDHLARNPLVPEASWLSDLVRAAPLVEASGDSARSIAVNSGVDDATNMLDAALTTWPRVNGWMVPDPRLGLPNADVLKSAAFQQFQIGSNDIAESAYLFVETDAEGAPLDGSDGARYELRFEAAEAPPVESPGGYWSVTMYDEHSFLVSNPLARYATRPERPGFGVEPDGSVVVTLSSELPDGVPEANWLPAPEGRFRLGLRVYYPGRGVVEGSWMPSPVRRRVEA